MFDDLLFLLDIPKDKVPVWEWAKRGWIKDVEELSPYFIALLRYPYLGIKEDDKSQYEGLKKNFIMFSNLIKSAINAGELPAKPIDFYDHHWPFSTFGMPGLNPLAEIARKQGKPKSHIQLPTHLIHRDDFRGWLIKKGAWQTLQETCLLRKWLDESCGKQSESPDIPLSPKRETIGESPEEIAEKLMRMEKSNAARRRVEARHNKAGGSREKRESIRQIWASGKYDTKVRCAEEESAALGISIDTALKALRNLPRPIKNKPLRCKS